MKRNRFLILILMFILLLIIQKWLELNKKNFKLKRPIIYTEQSIYFSNQLNNSLLPKCDTYPKNLIGNKTNIFKNVSDLIIPFSTNLNSNLTEDALKFFSNIDSGGQYEPKHCLANSRVGIIVPYRDREENLKIFLYHMHPLLQRQEIKYTIFVVEQINSDKFNKGKLMNSAFVEVINKTKDFDCVVFHDVDLLPTDDLNLYSCPEKRPKHLSILVGKTDWRKYYPILVGGVLIFRLENFIKINGYSNRFWGWGAEDDDMYNRLQNSGVGFDRPVNNTVYEMLDHKPWQKNTNRVKVLKEGLAKFREEGLNTINYKLKGIIKCPLFTHVLMDIGQENDTNKV
ncbi:unnamed protein product [Brachionus calyciflorus]|uniref:Beta-1,4-galactosyltransferase n=1 Tax=Brachionus calyciflorus TaxID=104777 RepID=A0A813ZZR6_9BILA|nr:unnamed protein product [Brachionus calyciflorus]